MLQTLDSTTEGKNKESVARHKQAGSDIQLNALQCLVATPTKIMTHTTVDTTTPLEHTHTKHNTNDALQNRRDHNEAAMFATRITIIEIPTQKNKKTKKKPTLQQQMKQRQKHTNTHARTRTHTQETNATLCCKESTDCARLAPPQVDDRNKRQE
jgi:hypothetical protein